LKVTPSEVITDAGPPRRARRADPVRMAPRRAVRQQPDRSRPRPPQTPAAVNARTTNKRHRTDHHRRARLHTAITNSPSTPRRQPGSP
jgi:hypothetical protein